MLEPLLLSISPKGIIYMVIQVVTSLAQIQEERSISTLSRRFTQYHSHPSSVILMLSFALGRSLKPHDKGLVSNLALLGGSGNILGEN